MALSTLKHWITPSTYSQSILSMIGGVVVAMTGFTPVAFGAERIIFNYGILEFYLSIDDLETYAQQGTISTELNFYLKRLDPKHRWLRKFLTTPYSSKGTPEETLIQLDRQLRSAEGETLLTLFGDVIQTESRVNGASALRASMILAADQSHPFTALEVLRQFPSQTIRVDIGKVAELTAKLKNLGQLTTRLRHSPITSQFIESVPTFVDDLAKLPTNEKTQMDEADSIIRQAFLEWLLHGLNVETGVVPAFEESLKLRRANRDRQGEGIILLALGWYYTYIGQPHEAIKRAQIALEIFEQDAPFEAGKALTLSNLGFAHFRLGMTDQAQAYFEQALKIHHSQKSNTIKLSAENFIQEFYQAAIFDFSPTRIVELIHNYAGEGILYQMLGAIFADRNDFQRATNYYEKALAIYQDIGFLDLEQWQLSYLASYHIRQQQYQEALKYIETSQALEKERRRKSGITIQLPGRAKKSLNTAIFKDINFYYLVTIYFRQNDYDKLENYLTQTLKDLQTNYQSPSNRLLGDIYEWFGWLYSRKRDYKKALDYHQKSLLEYKILGDLVDEARALSNIGYVSQIQGQSDLAIVLYKQSIHHYEAIRRSNLSLSRDVQASYIQSIANVYRQLADLLLSKGRVLEAQQVLELLKLQELRDYNRHTRSGTTAPGIDFDAIEHKILENFNTFIDFGQKIRDCQNQRLPCSDSEFTQLIQLRSEQTSAIQQILTTLGNQLKQRIIQDIHALDPKNDLSRKAQEIIAAQPDTVLIYSLVTDDRLWVMLASEADVLRTFEVPVSQKQLTDTVVQFRQLMKACESRSCGTADVKAVQTVSQQLYQWLLPPELRQELQGKGTRQRPIRNLVFAPDRVTRYIPFAALFDGNQYLMEQYAISTIVSAKLTDTRDRLPTNAQDISVLGLGLSNSVPPDFGPLPNVPTELNAIIKQPNNPSGIFKGLELLNQDFNWLALQRNLYGHNILHLATHGKFVPGSFEASYLLLGTGEKLPIPQIEQLSDLVGIHLVVLSACETALGGKREQDGLEIAGISNSFLERGAKAVLASLWQVNDATTSQLMQQFYQNLATGKMTKAEALRQAQRSLMTRPSPNNRMESSRGSVVFDPEPPGLTATIDRDLSHPYYWAPFILIGNGL